jgi:cobalt-zinc-cadmium efflux system outer membrane protein
MFLVSFILICLLSGCSQPCHQFSTRKSFNKVKKTTRINLAPDTLLQEKSYYTLLAIEDTQVTTLSLQQAISLALKNNPGLQATFKDLGIAQADLVQAGLFTNPELSALFRFPHRQQDDMNIEVDAPLINLADMWRVPLAKQVAEDELEAITKGVLEHILTIYADTKIAYYKCLFAQLSYDLVIETVNTTQKMLDWIKYRYEFGYETELDIKRAQIKLKNWQSASFAYHAELHNAFTHLTTLIGSEISPNPFTLTDNLETEKHDIKPLCTFEQTALYNRPEIQMQEMKVKKAYHNISLQRALALKDVRVGVSYKLDFEKQQGTGPSLNMQIPFFDWNQAQIQRAKVEAEMQDKIFLQTKRNVISEVQMHYRSYLAGLEEIALHSDALKIFQEAIAFAEEYAEKMMYSRTVIYQTTIDYFEERIAYMEKHFEAHKNFTMLEKAIGKQIS